MRTLTLTACRFLLLGLALHTAAWAQPDAMPAAWDAAYWQRTMAAIQDARDQGRKLEAEALCARAIPYAEAQAVPALRAYAALLDSQQAGSGTAMRGKADRLAQIQADQRKGTAPGSTYLGYAPAQEIARYADELQQAQRLVDARSMQALAAAYQRSQQVYVQRTLLMRQGKDPRGTC